jgi:2-polyprenyl-3-methyl-5-hydroxy-6-metoxy-1,4-benzoquinol methylase
MTANPLDYIYSRIELLNPVHYKKLKRNRDFFDERYYQSAQAFFERYCSLLQQENKTLDYAIDSYLRMIADVNAETLEFLRTGRYSSSTFAEVNARVYAAPEIMGYYMHGLALSQFLWKHHYQVFDYFTSGLLAYKNSIKSYLEIGAGHGLYLSKALELLNNDTTFTVVDISPTSIDLARRFTADERVNFCLKNIFELNSSESYDFITLGEVLEHVEDPLSLLIKINELLNEKGTLFITTPTNAPAIDHIYLFNNVDEIRAMIKMAGYEITSERSFLAEDVSPERAEKLKVTALYGAFLKKQ